MPQPPPTEAQQGPQQCTLYSLYSLYSNQTQGNIFNISSGLKDIE